MQKTREFEKVHLLSLATIIVGDIYHLDYTLTKE